MNTPNKYLEKIASFKGFRANREGFWDLYRSQMGKKYSRNDHAKVLLEFRKKVKGKEIEIEPGYFQAVSDHMKNFKELSRKDPGKALKGYGKSVRALNKKFPRAVETLNKEAVYAPALFASTRAVSKLQRSPELGGLTRPLSQREVTSSASYKTPSVRSLREKLNSNSLTFKVRARKDSN